MKKAVVVLLGFGTLSVAAVLSVQVIREWPTWRLLRRTVLEERVRVEEGDPLLYEIDGSN